MNNLIHDLVYSQQNYTCKCKNVYSENQRLQQFISFSYRSYKQFKCPFVICITNGHSFKPLFFKDKKHWDNFLEFQRVNRFPFFTRVKNGHFFRVFYLGFFHRIHERNKCAFVIRIINAHLLKPLFFNSKKFKAFLLDIQEENKYAFFTWVKFAYFSKPLRLSYKRYKDFQTVEECEFFTRVKIAHPVNQFPLRGGLWS